MIQKLELEEIHRDIANIVEESGVDYIDAVLDYCHRNDIEIEAIASIIKKSVILKEMVREDAEKLNMVEKSEARLEC